MRTRYRLDWRVWLPGALGWLSAAVFLGLFALFWDRAYLLIPVMLMAYVAFWKAANGLQSWVGLYGDGLGGRWNGRGYFLPWRVVQAVWVEGENLPGPVLFLGTAQSLIRLSLRGLPAREILRLVRLRLPPGIQTKQAKQEYITRRQTSFRLDIEQLVLPLEVGYSRGLKLFLWFAVAFWMLTILLSWISTAEGRLVYSAIFSFFLLVTLGLQVILAQRVRLDEEGVTDLSPLGQYRIQWSEIERAWLGAGGHSMILEGNGKRLAICGPLAWKGKHAVTAREYFFYQMDERGIDPQLDRWLDFKVITSNRSARLS